MKEIDTTFDIHFTDTYSIDGINPRLEKIAEIIIGDFREPIIIPVSYWSEQDYKKQWLGALYEILSSNNSSTALIVSMHDTKMTDSHIVTWPMYREGEIIYIQNRILFLEESTKYFEIGKIKTYIGERETVGEDGHVISEWQVGVEDIQKAVLRLDR